MNRPNGYVLIGATEAARLCGVSTNTFRNWVGAGLISPAQRTAGGFAKYNAADVEELVASFLKVS